MIPMKTVTYSSSSPSPFSNSDSDIKYPRRPRHRIYSSIRCKLFYLLCLSFTLLIVLLFSTLPYNSITSLISGSDRSRRILTADLARDERNHPGYGPLRYPRKIRHFHKSFKTLIGQTPSAFKTLAGHAIRNATTMLIHHTRPDRLGFRGEHLVHFSPLCFIRETVTSPISVHVPLELSKLSCTDHARNATISTSRCQEFRAEMEKEHGHFRKSVLKDLKYWPLDLVFLENRTTLFFSLVIARDLNICHALMRFLFAWNLLRTSRLNRENNDQTTVIPGFTDPPLIVILAPTGHIRRQYYSQKASFWSTVSGNAHSAPFFVGLLYYLFQRWGAEVIVSSSPSTLMTWTRGSVCFRHASLVTSHSNRFAFPDNELGDLPSHRLPDPLSSNAFALRSSLFAPRKPPRRREKLVYISRKVGFRRSFDVESEKLIIKLLTRITEEFGFTFVIHKSEPVKSFFHQVEVFADAAVVFGIHGAGLSLAVFAPYGCSVIEVRTQAWWVPLFGNLEAGGKRYTAIKLSNETTQINSSVNHLAEGDFQQIETAVRREVWLATQR